MVCTIISSMPIRYAFMYTVHWRSEFNTSLTCCGFLPSNTGPLNFLFDEFYMLWSLNTWSIIPNVSVPEIPGPTENLMANCCSIVHYIFHLNRVDSTKNTILPNEQLQSTGEYVERQTPLNWACTVRANSHIMWFTVKSEKPFYTHPHTNFRAHFLRNLGVMIGFSMIGTLLC